MHAATNQPKQGEEVTELTDKQAELCECSETDYSDLKAFFTSRALRRGHPGSGQSAFRLGR
jgi:hypothetical protein